MPIETTIVELSMNYNEQNSIYFERNRLTFDLIKISVKGLPFPDIRNKKLNDTSFEGANSKMI